jgi:hypothetical protein
VEAMPERINIKQNDLGSVSSHRGLLEAITPHTTSFFCLDLRTMEVRFLIGEIECKTADQAQPRKLLGCSSIDDKQLINGQPI